MTGFANRFLDSLPPVDGFILKGGSPTSGTSNVKVYPSAAKSMAIERSAGFFAREVLRRFSHLPIEDELRLNNARIRDHFLAGIFALAGFREVEVLWDREALARYHAANSSPDGLSPADGSCVKWGGWLETGLSMSRKRCFGLYREMLCAALSRVPRYTNNINVLQHVFGHFRNRVSSEEKEYRLRLIHR